MFYYIVKITIYSAPLVLVILESEFDVIFKWMYCVVDSSIKCRVTIIWKGIYAIEENLQFS